MNIERVWLSVERAVRISPILTLGLSLTLAGPIACSKTEAPPPPPPPEVEVAEIVQKDVPIYIELVGATLGSADVEIRARVEGYLVSMNFTEGAFVKKGQLLYRIDPQPFEAALAESRANLDTARARLDKTNNDVSRLIPLAKEQAVSQQELDNALSSQEAAKAQVSAAEARVAKAKLDLAYTSITSPVEGLIGTTQRKVGSLVSGGETLLNVVSQVNPIFFRCAIAEAEYLRLARSGAGRDKSREKKFGVDLILADGTVHPHKGRLDSVERAVDPTTGTLTGQFSFPNPERILRPNQYGRARFVTEVKQDAVLVPQRAVQDIQGLHSVLVVKPDNTVEQRMVKAGERIGNLWVIDSGAKPGEKVIVEGIQKVRPGVTVNAKPEKVEQAASSRSEAPVNPALPAAKGK
ncbi:MAG: efflux RND transporter periplasmic adaptor subunit [Candidatus Binatia bacterium]